MAVELLVGESKEGESRVAILACNDWLRMGAGRSLPALEKKYTERNQKRPPTRSIGTLKRWSTDFGWQLRADAYDQAIDAEKTAAADARRRAIMEFGLSQDYERINELNELYDRLRLEFVKSGLWYTDTKLSARGDTIDVEVFNKPLIDSLRGVLDDIAKEVGGRKQKTEVSGVNGEPIKTQDVGIDYSKLTTEQIAELIRIAEFAQSQAGNSTAQNT